MNTNFSIRYLLMLKIELWQIIAHHKDTIVDIKFSIIKLWNTFLPKVRILNMIGKTKPIYCRKSKFKDLEVVSLVSHNDLLMYLVMIKTFFFFSDDHFNVTVFDDGTLREADFKILKKYIIGMNYQKKKCRQKDE